MSLSIHKTLPKNPNPRSGCACSPHGKRADCVGPYTVFTATEAHDPRNPLLVIGFKCLQSAVAKAERTTQGKAVMGIAAQHEAETVKVPHVEPEALARIAEIVAGVEQS